MIYFPPLRRLLLPATIFLAVVVFYRSSFGIPSSLPSFVIHPPPPPPEGIRIPIDDLQSVPLPANATANYIPPASQFFYNLYKSTNHSNATKTYPKPIDNPALKVLWQCPVQANKYTNHVRISAIVRNITQIPPDPLKPEKRVFWNPTIISLPYWAENQYLVVSRIVTDGNHQENVVCEANICYVGSGKDAKAGEKPCTKDDLKLLGPAGGMRCASAPINLNVPPTPAEQCFGKFLTFVDVPGFHDPRIFWSGKGEPLMMNLLASSPRHPSFGPLKSYPTLTELTRNPPSTRASIEKNWFTFFTSNGESYIHYDLSHPTNTSIRGRTFAKLLGNGFTTTNLTDPLELPCLINDDAQEMDSARKGGTWHQATNSLRLILCNRSDPNCNSNDENTVFFAIIHRKFPNWLTLPMRYERHFMVWSATPLFNLLGISKHPILMANETASGWTESQNWSDDLDNGEKVSKFQSLHHVNHHGNSTNATISMEPFGGKGFWAYFTYTVSIAYAWGRGNEEVGDKNVGYLDDEVILAIGIDDKGQGFARAKAGDLVQCLRACPGRAEKEEMKMD
ncbi:MAG: hypothetical protein Q9209_001654 [Squamulea sp. 1 TL-2023]